MVVLGIDPGTAATGYGVVTRSGGRLLALDGGVIETTAGTPPADRLAFIFDELCGLLDEHAPEAMAVEELYFGANVRTAFAVGQARGVALLAAGQREIVCAAYTPQQVKSAVCGNGRAEKAQVQTMVAHLLALEGPATPDHAADALAVAICHANRAPLAAALASVRSSEPCRSAQPGPTEPDRSTEPCRSAQPGPTEPDRSTQLRRSAASPRPAAPTPA